MALAILFSSLSILNYVHASTVLFSDNFTNDLNWATPDNASGGSRTTRSSAFTVGTSGNGYLLQGATQSNPDDGVQREVSTHGFSTI